MSKSEEIQKEIDQYADARRTCEKAKNEFTAIIAGLVKEKADAEAEKPELGHGDFGIDYRGKPAMCVKLSNQDLIDVGAVCAHDTKLRSNDPMSGGYDKVETIFGNIFKLVEDWDEDLKEFKVGCSRDDELVYYLKAELQSDGDFRIGTQADTIDISAEQVYKFWCELGHLLMTLKKQK